MNIISGDEMNCAFRTAYNFLNNHMGVVKTPEEYKSLAEDFCDVIADSRNNPLACRLLSGVWDFICAESERVKNE